MAMYKKMCTYLIVVSAVFAIPEYNNTCVKSRDNIPRTSLVERESLICRLGLSAIYQCTMLALKGNTLQAFQYRMKLYICIYMVSEMLLML